MRRRPTPEAGDLYALLGVDPTASAEELRSAYRGLARSMHPDVSQADDAAARFAQIAEAYRVLSDPDQRRLYDATRRVVPIEPEPPESVDIFETFHSSRGVGFARRKRPGG